MVTVLKHALWNQKVNQSHWDKSDSGFYWPLCVCSNKLRCVAVVETADPWLPPRHPYASARTQELLPFIRAFMPEHFYYWALLHSSVSGCSVIWGGRPQRHWSISAPSALYPHFTSSPPPPPPLFSLLSSFFIWLRSSLLPIWPFNKQVHADTHSVHTCIVLSVTHTYIAIGSCAKVCVCVEPLALESRSRSLKHFL